ncbi:MAG TPA: glycosyltransferase [Dehalococcoidia bacterium]
MTTGLTLIIPTRNERENMPPLLRRIKETLGDLSYEVLIVDDSDDRTLEAAASVAEASGLTLRGIHREPGSRDGALSGAVVAGIADSRGTYICVLDADLQHPPELIRTMLSRAQEEGADVVIASRYLKGGSDEGLASGWRRFISVFAKYFAKALFFPRLVAVSDPLSGYFIVRRSTVASVRFKPRGFKILLEILVRSGARRVREVPMKFARRAEGDSKATLKQGMDFGLHAVTLFWDVRVRRFLP